MVKTGPYTLDWLTKETPGFRRMAQCFGCSEVFPIPLDTMIARNGPAAPLNNALSELECPTCQSRMIGVTLVRL